jgi:hypothetical protein
MKIGLIYRRIPTSLGLGSGDIVALTRLDSDLEAFSHNLSDGSFALLAFQPGA